MGKLFLEMDNNHIEELNLLNTSEKITFITQENTKTMALTERGK